jgi:RES domain-containing protein
MKVWRICKQRHAASAFSGEGARLFSGRWNSAGVPMVYTSESLSLAVVETFVHLDTAEAPDDLVSIAAELPVDGAGTHDEELLQSLKLPDDWRRLGRLALQKMGDEWIRSQRSLTMRVPSAVIDGEWNVLVNPEHRDAAKIREVEKKAFRFDARMFKR